MGDREPLCRTLGSDATGPPRLAGHAGMVLRMDVGVVWSTVRPHSAVTAAAVARASFADFARWNAGAWSLPAARW
jgi:hypothetical protein